MNDRELDAACRALSFRCVDVYGMVYYSYAQRCHDLSFYIDGETDVQLAALLYWFPVDRTRLASELDLPCLLDRELMTYVHETDKRMMRELGPQIRSGRVSRDGFKLRIKTMGEARRDLVSRYRHLDRLTETVWELGEQE